MVQEPQDFGDNYIDFVNKAIAAGKVKTKRELDKKLKAMKIANPEDFDFNKADAWGML